MNTENQTSAASKGARSYSPTFRGLWIDITLLEDRRFSAAEKILLAEIYALEGKGGCWSSNDHFCGLLNVKERMVRSYITKLENNGHLRSQNRASKMRRLWVSEELREMMAGKSKDRTRQPMSVSNDQPQPTTGQDVTAEPGNPSAMAEENCRDTRQQNASENTLREQSEKNMENTNVGFSIPDWLPASKWQEWVDHNRERGKRLTPKQMTAQVEELARLHNKGSPFGLVIDHAMQSGWTGFYELPASKRPLSYKALNGVRVMGGRVVI